MVYSARFEGPSRGRLTRPARPCAARHTTPQKMSTAVLPPAPFGKHPAHPLRDAAATRAPLFWHVLYHVATDADLADWLEAWGKQGTYGMHKALRQCSVFGNPHADMLIWHALNFEPEALEVLADWVVASFPAAPR